jgi:hypothetical protein
MMPWWIVPERGIPEQFYWDLLSPGFWDPSSNQAPYPFVPTLHLHCKPFRVSYCSAKFGTCTVVSVNGTLVEDNMRWFKGECAHFSFNKYPIYTLNGASAKFSTKTHTKRKTVWTSDRRWIITTVTRRNLGFPGVSHGLRETRGNLYFSHHTRPH